ncbi:MAG: VanW family protein [Clostridiales bacterium]|uniref:VanW family protein n=1 Tax=Terrisporobacter sp. TaxID=1965305 RepID=UPI002A37DC0E|nr:VanW family protein [Terrisporobacter sp.]MDD5878022.1 VanW family protein [Clostridiales bacterium]MDD7757485.1 VanW family protein [Clostridiales bacterium]MDY4137109.1 VanW family protein [Terrisporobacter sp.]
MKKLKIAILLSLLIVSFDNVVLSNAVGFEGKIHKNIYVRDIDISNLTREEAKNKINKIIESNNSFILNLSENKYVFLKEDIDVDYNVDDLIETAYGIGRNEGIISNIKTIGNLRLGKKIILDYRITYDEKKLNKYLMELNKKIYKKPKNATIRINNGQIIITKEKNGYKLNKDKLKNTLVEKIVNMDCSEEIIPIITIKPVYLYEDLSKIDTVLGRFETYFNSQNYNRSTNIKLAASATTNILLNQGEVFSFNSNIQNSDIGKYLKEAPVIINGKSEKGRGGGMCQVSSTIYNAALYSGMSIISVRNHSIPSPYIEKGRDATVSGGIIDLKFKNNYKTPVYIYNQVMGNKIVCTIYGNKRDKQDIEIITEITDEINNRIIRKNSEKYDLGVKTIEQEGRKGYKVKTYRVYKNDFGNKSEYIGESYYPPQDKIIIYGTRELRK